VRAGYCRRRGTARENAPGEAGRRFFLACGPAGQVNQASPARTEGGRAMRRCVVILALAAAAWALPAARAGGQGRPEGFQPLFNGKDLSGWTANEGGKIDRWGVEDGILFTTGKAGGGWLMTEKEYGDFELLLEYRVPDAGNSGVALRSPLKGDPAYVGMEIQ